MKANKTSANLNYRKHSRKIKQEEQASIIAPRYDMYS